MLPKEAIKEYQQVFFKDFGYEISKEDALIQLKGLMDLVRLLYKKSSSVDFREN